MFVYLSLFALPILRAFFFKESDLRLSSRISLSFMIIYTCIILCFGYMTGSDWRSYELAYIDFDVNNPFEYRWEKGFLIYMWLFKSLGVDFWTFFILTKIILYAVCIKTLLKYNLSDFNYTFLYFVVSFGLFLFIDNPMRNLIAISLFGFGYKYLIDRKAFKYFLLICIAASFHFSAVLLFPLYYLYKLDFKTYWIVTIFIMLNVVVVYSSELLISSISFITSSNPYLTRKFTDYFINSTDYSVGSIFSLGFIVMVFILILLLKYKNEFNNWGEKGVFVFKFSIIFLMLYRLALFIPIFGRFQLYFCYTFSIGSITCLYLFFRRWKPFYHLTTIILMVSLVYVNITNSYKYIPYSNYLQYLISNKFPNYWYRSNYNHMKSPYRDSFKLK